MAGGQIPRLNRAEDVMLWANNLANALELRLQALENTFQVGYSTTNNATPARTIDAAAATLAQTRIVVATLIDDLKQRGRLG